jgi:hypothetical protein
VVTQPARNLSFTALLDRIRFLIHDHDSKFSAPSIRVFRSESINVIHTAGVHTARAPSTRPAG